ncbi:MAG: hypothetical protein FWC97_00360 [Treponema sp.]|nr:hypothetical protein [Treponema sp.]
MKNDNDDIPTVDEINTQENDSYDDMTLAEQEFFSYCEANEFDYDEAGMEEDSRRDFVRIKKRFTKAIVEKRLVVDGCKIIYTVSNRSPKETAGTKFTIARPNGRALLAMDGLKDTQQQTKLMHYIAALCRVAKHDIGKISSLDKKDYQVLQDVAILFLTE